MIDWVEQPRFVYKNKGMAGAILDALVRVYEFDWTLLSKEGIQYAVKYRELTKLQQDALEEHYLQVMRELDKATPKRKRLK